MSKLAHSNQQTMDEIELRRNGFTPIFQSDRPKCQQIVRKYHDVYGQCTRYATWEKGSRLFCTKHAKDTKP